MAECNLYLTDKSEGKWFRTTCTFGFHQGELRNLEHRLDLAKAGKVKAIDAATVRLVMLVDGKEQAPEPLLPWSDDVWRELLGE